MREEKTKGKDMSIRGQIRSDNGKIIYIIVFIVVLSTINLLLIDWYQNRQTYYSNLGIEVRDIIISQHEWRESIAEDISSSQELIKIKAEMDPEKCKFGVWYNTTKQPNDEKLKADMQSAYDAHKKMHDIAYGIVTEAALDKTKALERMNTEISASAKQLFDSLGSMEVYYTERGEKNHSNLITRIIWAIMTNIVFAFLAAFLARRLGNKLATKISRPITAVADWSEELSIGAADLEFNMDGDESANLKEVKRMVESFKIMAHSIQENVNVVQKVADGDMTAFVNVRSSSDSLGKNLYRMVQSNDLMFAEITDIAESVAEGAGNIAQASGALAQSCSIQANAVKEFSEVVQKTGEFIVGNNVKAQNALEVSDEIQKEIEESTEKMNELLDAMGEIRISSEKISAIIRTINDIAGQTNMLALNAAIEAARAGEAGKGFAVVANEVKDLAAKSAEAAQESKSLIEDTMHKTALGDTISKETSSAFVLITESIGRIAEITRDISASGIEQQNQIRLVQDHIMEISDAIDGNAASSQEAAAASDELNTNADELKEAMCKFNLRKREPGKPYIPPEKANDPEFIREAENNYKKAMKKKIVS